MEMFVTFFKSLKHLVRWVDHGILNANHLLQFSYKDKSNKHPLRQVKQKSLEETSPTHKPPAGTNRPTAGTGNRTTAAKPPGPKGVAVSKDAVSLPYFDERRSV